MAAEPFTVDDILEILTQEEKEEVLRPDLKVPLQHFLTGYNRNPLFPQVAVLQKFKNYARRRSAVKNAVTRNPEILKTAFKDPIFIIGLPRSGTTLLHRLLTRDPQFIAPMYWEMIEPVPPGRPENWKECDRFKNASEDPELAALTSGVLDKSHYVRMDSPEECYVILRQYFLDLLDPLTNGNLTELKNFMYNFPEEHATNTYEFYKMFLQCLFYGNMKPGVKLILKCPIHCLYLETLRKTFPTARFIFPYRDAKTTVASFSSLVNDAWTALSGGGDPLGAGERVTEFFKQSSSRAITFLNTLSKESYISLPYREMVDNPLYAVQQIYSHFGLDLHPETVDQMQIYLKENYQHKHGQYEYNAEDYGITDEVIKENMKEYLEYFANSPEKLL